MYVPKSLLSRLLSAAWTLFLAALLMWSAVHLLSRVWTWLLIFGTVTFAIWIGFRLWRHHRERW